MYKFRGVIIKGNQRGKGLGFPTANVPLTAKIAEGIYASTVSLDDKNYNAITFIGPAKTFNETVYQSETYILDFNLDIYGKEIIVFLHKKLRDNEKFTTIEALIETMKQDEVAARIFFSETTNH
jgi:riboflavin kinase/FMN adenylyltransferase